MQKRTTEERTYVSARNYCFNPGRHVDAPTPVRYLLSLDIYKKHDPWTDIAVCEHLDVGTDPWFAHTQSRGDL